MYSNHTINNESKHFLLYNDVIWLNLSEKPYCLAGVRKFDKFEHYFEKDSAFPDQSIPDREKNYKQKKKNAINAELLPV